MMEDRMLGLKVGEKYEHPAATTLHDVEQLDLRGTLFLTTIFLMMIFGFRLLMYFEMLGR
jgi:hypothetical protein